MTAASQPQLITLRSGDVVRIRPIRPDDAPAMLALLPGLGQVRTESHGPVVTARVELAEPSRPSGPDVLDLLTAAARGDILALPVLLRRLIRVPEGLAHFVRLPVSAVLRTPRPGPGLGGAGRDG